MEHSMENSDLGTKYVIYRSSCRLGHVGNVATSSHEISVDTLPMRAEQSDSHVVSPYIGVSLTSLETSRNALKLYWIPA